MIVVLLLTERSLFLFLSQLPDRLSYTFPPSPTLLPIGYLGLFYSGRWSWNFKEPLEAKNFVSQIWLMLSALRKFRLERPDEEVKFPAEQQTVGNA
jgi:hypothetical protein